MATPRRDHVLSDLQALKAGLEKHYANLSVMVATKTYTGAALSARVQKSIDAAEAVVQAHAALAQAVAAEKRVAKAEAQFLAGIRGLIRTRFSDSAVNLADFAMTPRKPRARLPTEAEILRVEKMKSTRNKRRTMGSRQKKAIKGEVTGVVIAPVVGPGRGSKGGG